MEETVKDMTMEDRKDGNLEQRSSERTTGEPQTDILEMDSYSDFLTDLGFGSREMLLKEARNLTDLSAAEKLNFAKTEYYQKLMENKGQILIRFSGFRERGKGHGDELFVLFGDLELVYPVERIIFEKEPDISSLLDREYVVFVRKILPEERKVILADSQVSTRKQVVELINEKLENREEIYLRGNIIALQKNGGKKGSEMAAYVNIEGMGIIGIIPIKQWSVGYSATEYFRSTVRNNRNAIINFRITSKTRIYLGYGTRYAYVCSRKDFLTKIGYEPWKIVEKRLTVRSTVLVQIIEEGKSPASFFGAIDGIGDFNMLCYKDDNSDLSLHDICPGQYYYGYVQKMDVEKKFLRIRLTQKAQRGSEMKRMQTETEGVPEEKEAV